MHAGAFNQALFRMTHLIRLSGCVLMVTLSVTGCLNSGPPPVEHHPRVVDFSGSWEVDFGRSDDPRQQLLLLFDRMAERVSLQADSRSRYEIRQMQEDLSGIFQLAEEMTRSTAINIDQSRGYVEVRRNEDFALVCDFSSRETSRRLIGPGVEYCGFDETGQLVFVVRLREGLTVTNRFVMAHDRSRISMITSLGHSRLPYPVTLRRMFMPYEEGESAWKCEFTLAKKTTCWFRSDDPEVAMEEAGQAVKQGND